MVEQPVRFNLIGAYLSHEGVKDKKISARSANILSNGLELKVKIGEEAIKHGNSRYALGFIDGDIEVSGSLVTPLDTPELEQFVQDSIQGAVITLVGIGKLEETGAGRSVIRVIGVRFTEYDTKYEGKKIVNPSANFNAVNWTKVTAQIITS